MYKLIYCMPQRTLTVHTLHPTHSPSPKWVANRPTHLRPWLRAASHNLAHLGRVPRHPAPTFAPHPYRSPPGCAGLCSPLPPHPLTRMQGRIAPISGFSPACAQKRGTCRGVGGGAARA